MKKGTKSVEHVFKKSDEPRLTAHLREVVLEHGSVTRELATREIRGRCD